MPHQWRPKGDERAMVGIQDCLHVLRQDRRFCAGRLLPRVFSSKAARRITGSLDIDS